jgi:hypothetical protein
LPGVDFQAVRAKVSISDVRGLVGFAPCETHGDQVRGPCPIHGSASPKSRSFSVHLARNAFRCFKYGESGNQLDLWAATTKTDLYAATIDLCRRLHIDIPWIDPNSMPGSHITSHFTNREEEPVNPVRLDCCRGVGRWQAVYWRRRAGGQKSVARRNTVRGAGHFGAAANAVAVARTGDRALGVGVLFL